VALLDRALGAIGGRPILHIARVIIVAIGLFALGQTVSSRMRLPLVVIAIVAFHPIVFMYGGALRWYPILFLAQSLRCWGLWGPRAGSTHSTGALLVGSVLGGVASTLDVVFVVVDALWLALLQHKTGRRWIALSMVLLSLSIAVASAALNPGSVSTALNAMGWGDHVSFPRSTMTWALLGVAGERHLPFPALLLALLPVAGVSWGLWSAWRTQTDKGFLWWFLSVQLAWGMSTLVVIDQPRYSLLSWVVLTAFVAALWHRGSAARVFVVVSATPLIIGLVLTVIGSGALKGDLNGFPQSACEGLVRRGLTDVVIAPYPRSAAMIRRTCEPSVSVLTLPSSHHVRRADEHMAPLRSRITSAREIVLMTHVTPSGSLRVTFTRARELLAERCRVQETRELVEEEHFELKRIFLGRTSRYRYRWERWVCSGGAMR
jgi:hypothetical protein